MVVVTLAALIKALVEARPLVPVPILLTQAQVQRLASTISSQILPPVASEAPGTRMGGIISYIQAHTSASTPSPGLLAMAIV